MLSEQEKQSLLVQLSDMREAIWVKEKYYNYYNNQALEIPPDKPEQLKICYDEIHRLERELRELRAEERRLLGRF